MKKFLFIILFIIAFASGSFAQDYILFKNGEKIAVTILTVADEYVRYYHFDDPARKMYAKDIAGISKLLFQNGMQLTYSKTNVQTQPDKREVQREEYPPSETQNQDSAQIQNPVGDLLFLRDGQSLSVVILEITPEIVKYKDFDNPAGPVYSIYKSDVKQIILQNGKIEAYTETPERHNLPFNNRREYRSIPEDYGQWESAPQKQSRLQFGVKGGMNVSTFSGLKETFDLINENRGREMKTEGKTGFHAGLMCQVNLHSNTLFLQPELQLSLQGAERIEADSSFTNDLFYLQLPVSLIYKIKMASNADLFLGAGVYLAYGIYGSGKTFEEETKRQDYGITFQGGFQFGKVQITGAYDLGMYEVINAKNWAASQGINGIPELRTRNLKISLGYFF
jgi:hypothetical protein